MYGLRIKKYLQNFKQTTTRDERVEIVATMLGTFILGASFAKEFFLNGHFEIRVFLFGISCFVLFFAVTLVSNIRIQIFVAEKRLLSFLFALFFCIGTISAAELINSQLLAQKPYGDVRLETALYLASYTIAANILYAINRIILLKNLKQKTIYKYLLAPINGLSLGVIVTGIFVWSIN